MNVSLYQAASALNATDRWQETIAENLASSSLPGYKKQEFVFTAVPMSPASKLALHGNATLQTLMPSGSSATNFTPGAMRPTNIPTDLAIQGNGFFEVQLPNGVPAFTRDGEFHVSAQGQLVSKQGYLLQGDGGPIQLDPHNSSPISVSPSGDVSQGSDRKGKLKLVEFSNSNLLAHLGGGYFAADEPGLTSKPSDGSSLRQGYLESSNTSTVREMTNLITAMRTFEANQRVVQIHDERMGRVIQTLDSNG